MKKIKLGEFLLVDKPAGWSSFAAVAAVRRRACAELDQNKLKVGHAGTLDPFATGLLIVGVGREATRRLDDFRALPKVYRAELALGAVSDTGDPTGAITRGLSEEKPSVRQIKAVLRDFLGEQTQIPPMFSAKKVGGERLYKLARQGREIERKPSEIEIYKIKLKAYKYPRLEIEVRCSAGTYIRVLAEDIGKKLGVGAYCRALRRTRIGKYRVERAEKWLN